MATTFSYTNKVRSVSQKDINYQSHYTTFYHPPYCVTFTCLSRYLFYL